MFQNKENKEIIKLKNISSKLALPKINIHSLELDKKQEDESLNIKNLKLLKEIYKLHDKIGSNIDKKSNFK